MRWILLLMVMTGCAGAKVVVGFDYLFRDSTTEAASQFWPAATASIDQNDEYVARLEVHVPLGHQEVRIVNAHELVPPATMPMWGPAAPVVIDRSVDPEVDTKTAIRGLGGLEIEKGTDPWLVAAVAILVTAVGWVSVRVLRAKKES